MKPLTSLKEHRSIYFFIYLLTCLSIVFIACQSAPGDLLVDDEYLESQSNIWLMDTLTVELSTVIFDTMQTNSTGMMFIGDFEDNIFGHISCQSFFQVGLPTIENILENDEYDSLNLIITHSNYVFGDSTTTHNVFIHRLTERIEYDEDDRLTHDMSFAYDPNPAGTASFTPDPSNSTDTLFIRLDDELGLDLFTKMQDQAEILSDIEAFLGFLNGFLIKTDGTNRNAIVGFSSADEYDIKLILHTHRESSTAKIDITHNFNLYDISKQFNQILYDFSNTKLAPLKEQRNELASTETDGLAFLQGGLGLGIRIDFPSLEQFLLFERSEIAEAILYVAPQNNSYHEYDLPTSLWLNRSDKYNALNGYTASSSLIIDELYDEETAYYFNVTNYFTNELSDDYVDPENGLIFTLPTDEMKTSFSRLILDSNNSATKLKLYFLTY